MAKIEPQAEYDTRGCVNLPSFLALLGVVVVIIELAVTHRGQ